MCLGQCPAVPGQTTDGVPPGQCRTAPWPGSSTRQHSSTAHQHRHRCSILYIGIHNTVLLNMSLFTLNWDACPPNQWVLWLAKNLTTVCQDICVTMTILAEKTMFKCLFIIVSLSLWSIKLCIDVHWCHNWRTLHSDPADPHSATRSWSRSLTMELNVGIVGAE